MAECPRCRKADCPTLGGSRWFPQSSMEACRSCAIDTAKRLEAAEAELASDEHFRTLATELKVEWNARVAAEATIERVRQAAGRAFYADENPPEVWQGKMLLANEIRSILKEETSNG